MGILRIDTQLNFSEELSKFSNDGLRQVTNPHGDIENERKEVTDVHSSCRQSWTTITIKPDPILIEAFHNKWQETLIRVKDTEGFILSFGFHPLTKSLLEASAEAGGNALNIPPSDGPLFVVLINPIWQKKEDDQRVFGEIDQFVTDLRSLASEKGPLHRYVFANYAHSNDNVLASYGEESLARTREASRKYDPAGVFQTGVPGGFKLPPESL